METTEEQEEDFYLGSIMSYFLDSNVLIDWGPYFGKKLRKMTTYLMIIH